MGRQDAVSTSEGEAAIEGGIFACILECPDTRQLTVEGLGTGQQFDAKQLGAHIAAEKLGGERFAESLAVSECAADQKLNGGPVCDGLEAFEEVGPSVEPVHFFDFVAFVVEGFGVMFESEGKHALVKVQEVGVAKFFSQIAPGESCLELKGSGHFAPPDFIRRGALAGQQHNGVEGSQGCEIAIHGNADFARRGSVQGLVCDAVEPEQAAGYDSAIEEVAVAARCVEFERHRTGFRVPGGKAEEICRTARGEEKFFFTGFFKQKAKAGDGVAGNLGGDRHVPGDVGLAIPGKAARFGLNPRVEQPLGGAQNGNAGNDWNERCGTQPKIIL